MYVCTGSLLLPNYGHPHYQNLKAGWLVVGEKMVVWLYMCACILATFRYAVQ